MEMLKTVVEEDVSRRSVSRLPYIQEMDKIVEQPWPYGLLKTYSNNHPYLRLVHGAIINQLAGPHGYDRPWETVKRFAKKCTACGMEFKTDVDKCECGSLLLRGPNPTEKTRLENFIRDPNRDDELRDIIISLLKDVLAVDDCYISVAKVLRSEYVIYAEDAAEIFVCADQHGRLGNGMYFCPKCWRAAGEKGADERVYEKGETCPECGGETVETVYVQKHEGTIKARYGRDEIIHRSGDPWLPNLYGNSKVMACLTELRSALAMSSRNFDMYSSGILNKIVGLEGTPQPEANALSAQTKEQLNAVEIDSWTGRVGRKVRTLFIGTRKGMTVADAMPDSQKMQSLEWAEFWLVKIVGGIYGVQPVMMNAPVRASGGYYQKMQLTVQYDVIQVYQDIIESMFNDELLPLMGIKDWLWRFTEIEPINEMEQAQIWQSKIAAGVAAVESGLTAQLTDQGELKISGVFKPRELPDNVTGLISERKRSPKIPDPQLPRAFAIDKNDGEE